MSDPRQTPAPLLVAASLVAVEALVLLLLAVLELAGTSGERLTVGLSTAAFFVLYAVALGACARALQRCRSWARGPVALAQLIQLGMAWSFRGGGTTWVSVALAVVAVVVLAGLLHPASTDALGSDGATDGAGDG